MNVLVTAVRNAIFCQRSIAWVVVTAAVVTASMSPNADAGTVSGWGLETGFTSATLTEGVSGSFSTSTPTGNAAPRALISPIDFSDPGDVVQFTGQVTLSPPGANIGNQQFRIGLWDTNGANTGTLSGGVWNNANANGWLGYMVQVGISGGQDSLKGRTDPNSAAWLSNTGTYNVNNTNVSDSPAAGTYDFTMTLTRNAFSEVSIAYTLAGGNSINRVSGLLTDTNAAASALTTIDAVGFLLNTNTGAGSFTNLQVSAVPEPGSVALLVGAGIAGMIVRRRRLAV
jgi:hypothetical protein